MASREYWRQKYAYIRPYALQSKKLTYHALPAEGPYYPPKCIGGNGSLTSAILVLRENMEALPGAKPCRRCHAHNTGKSPDDE